MTCLCCQVIYVSWYDDGDGGLHEQQLDPSYSLFEVLTFRFYKEYAFKIPLNSVASIARQFRANHPERTAMNCYGDSQGLNRVEGKGTETRYDWVRDEFIGFVHNQSQNVVNPNIAPLKCRDMLNEIFADRHRHISIQFDPSCVELIDDLVNCKQGIMGKIKKRVKNNVDNARLNRNTSIKSSFCTTGLNEKTTFVVISYIRTCINGSVWQS